MALETQGLEPPGSRGEDDNILPKGAILQNRYEIIKVLGVGGMGAVYLSQDLRFTGVKRLCALKEMISTTPDPHVRRLAVESFKREANLLVELRHPGIPQIYDFFTDSVRSYLAMEYVEGDNLEDVLDKTEGMLKEEIGMECPNPPFYFLKYLHLRTHPCFSQGVKV